MQLHFIVYQNGKLKELNKCSIRSGNLFSVQYLHHDASHLRGTYMYFQKFIAQCKWISFLYTSFTYIFVSRSTISPQFEGRSFLDHLSFWQKGLKILPRGWSETHEYYPSAHKMLMAAWKIEETYPILTATCTVLSFRCKWKLQ